MSDADRPDHEQSQSFGGRTGRSEVGHLSDRIHRIFLAPLRSDVDREWAHEHWTSVHAGVFARTPGLRGYTQNRPLRAEWSTRSHVCAEAWFANRYDEAAAWGDPYYRGAVTEDEARFVARDDAWVARATVVRRARRTRRHRVLVFGQPTNATQPWVARWNRDGVDEFTLSRPAPPGDTPSLVSFWTDDLDQAREVAFEFGAAALLARPVAVVTAPEPPWTPDDTTEPR